ncbi:hypothetical protein P9D28_09005 [Bacillus haynesii]|uniref:hypothetical protein n=1 Tax=Bacillus haynesii TaxID=1925021 RepID=UPI002DBEB6C5|nr:hypothetical protein [Bacillus haynesii]MEC1552564.1 hypothetical protein [Bacillus haynesii]
MTRRVVQWSAIDSDREKLQVITVFEEGISKQDVKREVPFSRWHGVLYKTERGKGYDFK